MNIIFISEFCPPHLYGGAEISTSLLVSGLKKRHHCTVITSELENREWVWQGVRVIPLLKRHHLAGKNIVDILGYGLSSIISPLINIVRLRKQLTCQHYDVINFVETSYSLLPVIVLVSLLRKEKIVVDMRDFTSICVNDLSYVGFREESKKHNCFRHLQNIHTHPSKLIHPILPLFNLYEVALFEFYKSIFRWFVNRCPKVYLVALSNYVKQKLVQNGIKPDKISVIPNISIVASRSSEKVVAEYDFVFAGRLDYGKGIWDAIKAYEKLNMGDVKFAIAGNGTEYEEIKTYIETRRLSNVYLLGTLSPDDVIGLYIRSKFIVAPAKRPEPFGRFVQESMTTGTPVIATRSGGIPEGIDDRISGFLVRPNDLDALTSTMKEAIAMPREELSKMRAAIISKGNKYSEAVIVEKRVTIYGDRPN
jgi:glycosyltransferase involved in cell wall biosynthesis